MIEGSTITLRGHGLDLAADRWAPAASVQSRGTVLLLHGGGQTRHSWQRTGAILAANGWTAYALDARGHGDSGWAPDGDYGTDAMVADLRHVIAALGVRPVLVGASMGGLTSLVALGEDKELACGLVLVDIAPRAEPAGLRKITDFMRRGIDGFDSVDDALQAVIAYNPHRHKPPRAEGLLKNLRRRQDRWYWHWDPRVITGRDAADPAAADAARAARARAAALAIEAPTLLVRGAQSDVVSADGAQELLGLIPTATRIDVTGAGHMVSGDDNHVLSQGLLTFLTESVHTRAPEAAV